MNFLKPSCLKCKKFLTCRDSNKGPKYSCDSYVRMVSVDSILDLSELGMIPNGDTDYNTKSLVSTEVQQAELAVDANDSYSLEETPEAADFIWQAMRQAYDPLTNSVRDLKVDESSILLSKNYYHFCSEVAGSSIKVPFSRQLWIAATLLGEYCPVCTKDSWKSIDNVPVDMDSKDLSKKLVMFRHGVCLKCGTSRAKCLIENLMPDYNQLVLVAGQRAGKSAFTATLNGYHFHQILKAPRMSTLCRGIQDFTPLTGTFVALTTGRAIKLLWNPFYTLIDHSDWFKEYFQLLSDYGNRYGKEFFRKRDLFIRIFHKNLDYCPMGPMKRTLRGDTRVISSTDEIGWFPYKAAMVSSDEEGNVIESDEEDEREMANGDEVHQALDNSLSTFRTEVWHLYKQNISVIPTGLNINISSPQSWKDKICRLLKDSEKPEALSLGIRLPTWGINPLYTRDHPIIRSAYSKNPRRAERDFGANPPSLSESMFLLTPLRESFTGKQHHSLVYDEDDPTSISAKLIELVVKNKWKPNILGLDAGLVNNSFGLCLGSRDDSSIEVHTAIELIPMGNRMISFPRLYKNVLLPLVKTCNVCYLAADRWNSINLLQQVEEDTKGKTKWIQISLQPHHFSEIKDLINSGSVTLPALSDGWTFERVEEVRNYRIDLKKHPIEHLYLQFVTVQRKNDSVIKGEGFTDDLFRAFCVMAAAHFTPRVRKYMLECKAKERDGLSNRAVTIVSGRTDFMLR